MAKKGIIQLENILEIYTQDVAAALSIEMERIGNETVKRLKATAPRGHAGGKQYADGFAKKTIRSSSRRPETVIVYNRTKPGLTHLLSNGHAKINGGRVEGDGHWQKAEEWANAEFIKAVQGIWR